MGTALDALAQQPLNSRRPAAPTLPKSARITSPECQRGQPIDSARHQPVRRNPRSTTSTLLGVRTALGWPPQNWAYPARTSFSPSGRSASVTAPPTTDGLPQPFEAPPLASYPQGLQGLPAPSSIPHASHPVTMSLYPSGPAASPAPLPSNDPYNPKPPLMYSTPHLANAHQTGFSPMYGAPPIGAAGLGIHPSARMLAQSTPAGQPSMGFQRQPWPSYSLPAMSGPVMTNVHSPNSPIGHVASTQHLYGGQPPHGIPAPSPDRPFKCDQCPQSFNRNHDLKRHKRIHLAVKPFPCAHCDKSFSRKDALKRHILVKGCGKDGDSEATQTALDGSVKADRSEDGSPTLNGRV
ncbi:hypothetical protein N7468_000696 [Penicillium chermesinum]|uniref:C2H2-type domain-containing protein n=1 Tax=Penicillium chermesinum TaxID=63820 RepID=A0A9W9TZL3_9EURO|nr:uncharacterized protein N7468_000696 [Penicillium chermesinum]KAJ5249245.1 hypothetical protein N7468_000696 [Penicillium chermesinum]